MFKLRDFLRGLSLAALSLVCADEASADELLVASFNNNQVLRFDLETDKFLGTLISGGGLSQPSSMTFTPDGDLLVASFSTNRVQRYDALTGALLGDFVHAGAGGLAGPAHIAFGPDGYLYVSSTNLGALIRYDGATGAFVDYFVPTGTFLVAPGAFLWGPTGQLIVASTTEHRILLVDPQTGAYQGDLVPSGKGGLVTPRGLVLEPAGDLLVASSGTYPVLRYNAYTGSFAGVTLTTAQVSIPSALTLDGDGNLYVGSIATNDVRRVPPDSSEATTFVPPGAGGLNGPSALTVTPPPRPELFGPFPGLTGEPNTLSAAFMTPGGVAVFLVGTLAGPLQVGPDLELGLLDPIVLGIALTDVKGQAHLALDVPAEVSGRQVLFQTLDFPELRATGVIEYRFP